MKVRILASAAVMTALAGPALAVDDAKLMKKANETFDPIPTETPELEDNKITEPKVDLGRMLYFEPRLSKSQLVSCNTCHNVGTGGDDNLETSIGHGWQKGPRNAPTVFNAVFNEAQFWDGRAEDLAAQAKGPIQASVEMNNEPSQVVKTLKSIPEYREAFAKAFPDADKPVNFDNVADAIEAYEATLLTPNAPFDQFLRGDKDAMSAKAKQGLKLFMDKGCSSCHNGRNVGGHGYYPFGVVQKPGADVLPRDDKGRFAVTQTADDEYVFRAPPLRNVARTAPYFHSGKVWQLEQAVQIMGSAQLGIDLNDKQAGKIVTFLKSLNGDIPTVTYPKLPVRTAETPKPKPMMAKEEKTSH